MSLDFAQSCIIIATILVALSISKYRLIALTILINFIAFELSARYMLDLLNGAPSWPLHAVYILISGLTIICLVKLGASRLLYSVMFLFSLYNFFILFEFIWHPIGFHDNYVITARVQMIFELVFMILMSRVASYVWDKFKPDNNYNYFIDRLFISSFRVGFTRLAR